MIRNMRFSIVGIMLCLCSVVVIADGENLAGGNQTSDDRARAIMEKMDNMQRMASDSALTKSQLSSCKFSVKNKKLACVESPRVKVMESVTIQEGENKKDGKSVSIVLNPASERGIGMLTFSYDDPQKDTESWLYLSAVGKVKRMASGSEEDREPVAFFGSEFTTEDLENGKTDEYDYNILEEGAYKGNQVWVIEAKPKPVRLRKTNYSKMLIWLDKEKFIAHKVETFNKRNERYKRMLFKNIVNINDIWMARDVTIMNLQTRRLSRMKTLEIALGVDVNPEFLTQRTLTDKAFREKNLRELRQFIQ